MNPHQLTALAKLRNCPLHVYRQPIASHPLRGGDDYTATWRVAGGTVTYLLPSSGGFIPWDETFDN